MAEYTHKELEIDSGRDFVLQTYRLLLSSSLFSIIDHSLTHSLVWNHSNYHGPGVWWLNENPWDKIFPKLFVSFPFSGNTAQ